MAPYSEDPLSLLQMQQRMAQLEALIQEMRLEIEYLQQAISPEARRRLQKLQTYQKTMDHLFETRESA
jgi:hypothetical protein